MLIGKRAIDAGASILRDAGISGETEASELASRVFKEMMNFYSSEPQLIPYSHSPRPQKDAH
jgi:hypothetical protein